MKPTLSYEMHTIYTGAIYLKAVMAFHRLVIGRFTKIVNFMTYRAEPLILGCGPASDDYSVRCLGKNKWV